MVKNSTLEDKPEFICVAPVDASHIIPYPLCLLRSSAGECPKAVRSYFEMNLRRLTEPTESVRAVLMKLTVIHLPKKFLPILCKLKGLYLVPKRPPLLTVMSQMNPFRTL